MPPPGGQEEDLEKKVKDGSWTDHIIYGAPTLGGASVCAYMTYYPIGNFVYNILGSVLGYSSYTSIASSVIGGVLSFGLGGLAVGGLLSLVSKRAKKYFGRILGRGKPKEAEKAKPPG